MVPLSTPSNIFQEKGDSKVSTSGLASSTTLSCGLRPGRPNSTGGEDCSSFRMPVTLRETHVTGIFHFTEKVSLSQDIPRPSTSGWCHELPYAVPDV